MKKDVSRGLGEGGEKKENNDLKMEGQVGDKVSAAVFTWRK
jgi:hypothetical protein